MLTRQHLRTRTRCVQVAATATVCAVAAARALVPAATRPVPTVDTALVRLCLLVLLAAAGWAWLAIHCVVAEAWRGRPARRVPAALRRAVLVCCGVALVTPVGAASADDLRPLPTTGIAGLPMPERATGPARLRPHRADPPRTVVVSPGDSLWLLAAAELPDDAGPARIASRWHAIHRRNHAVIGPDPDLIHPGQRLVLPPR